MRLQQLWYRHRKSRMTLLRGVCHRVGRQIPEEQLVVVEAEVDRQDRQDHQEDHCHQNSEHQDRMDGMRELIRSYLNDLLRFRDT